MLTRRRFLLGLPAAIAVRMLSKQQVEHGLFVPTVIGSGIAYHTAGTYTRKGDIVTVHITVQIS